MTLPRGGRGEGEERRPGEGVVRTVNPTAVVWRGSQLPARELGIKVLGTPLGQRSLQPTSSELLQSIKSGPRCPVRVAAPLRIGSSELFAAGGEP